MLDWRRRWRRVIDDDQRHIVIDTFREAGNILLGGMVIGQFITDRPFSPALGGMGVGMWAIRRAVTM